MVKYYNNIIDKNSIRVKSGQNALIPIKFKKDSASVIFGCSFVQSQIQAVLFSTHGSRIFEASAVAREIKSPNSRMDFLCSTPYGKDDEILSAVFSYTQNIFRDIYDLRNVLAHEIWMSCDDYNFKVLFSSIDEQARYLKIVGKLKHDESTNSRDVHNAIIRYIEKIKIIGCEDLKSAIEDIRLCEWILMTINQILEEVDPQKRDDLKMAFLTFRRTSHLFAEAPSSPPKIEVRSTKEHRIHR